MADCLIVYYSRSGSSEIVAKKLAVALACDLDRITYADGRESAGALSFAAAMEESGRRETAPIAGDAHDPGSYNRILFISPLWSQALATPVRSYMQAHQGEINEYDLFIVCGSGGLDGAVQDAESVLKKPPRAARQIFTFQVRMGGAGFSRLL